MAADTTMAPDCTRDPLPGGLGFALHHGCRMTPTEWCSAIGGPLGRLNRPYRYHTMRERAQRLYVMRGGATSADTRTHEVKFQPLSKKEAARHKARRLDRQTHLPGKARRGDRAYRPGCVLRPAVRPRPRYGLPRTVLRGDCCQGRGCRRAVAAALQRLKALGLLNWQRRVRPEPEGTGPATAVFGWCRKPTPIPLYRRRNGAGTSSRRATAVARYMGDHTPCSNSSAKQPRKIHAQPARRLEPLAPGPARYRPPHPGVRLARRRKLRMPTRAADR